MTPKEPMPDEMPEELYAFDSYHEGRRKFHCTDERKGAGFTRYTRAASDKIVIDRTQLEGVVIEIEDEFEDCFNPVSGHSQRSTGTKTVVLIGVPGETAALIAAQVKGE